MSMRIAIIMMMTVTTVMVIIVIKTLTGMTRIK